MNIIFFKTIITILLFSLITLDLSAELVGPPAPKKQISKNYNLGIGISYGEPTGLSL